MILKKTGCAVVSVNTKTNHLLIPLQTDATSSNVNFISLFNQNNPSRHAADCRPRDALYQTQIS